MAIVSAAAGCGHKNDSAPTTTQTTSSTQTSSTPKPMTEYEFAESVKDQANSACTRVEDATVPNQGTISGQSVVMKKDIGKDYYPSFDLYGLPLATSAAMFKSLVCIDVKRVSMGTYVDPGGNTTSADRRDWDVAVLSWPAGDLIAQSHFQGGDPPDTCTATTTDRSACQGSEPTTAARDWLNTVITPS